MSKKRKAPKQRPAPTRTAAATKPTSPKQRPAKRKASPADMVFGRENYVVMIAGLALIVLGMILMSGGAMPSPDVWEPSRIYSPMRITIAPIVILTGLALNIYAIFRKTKPTTEVASEEQ